MGQMMSDELAGIEYCGVSGASHDCQNAVLRLLQFGDDLIRARIVSCRGRHCLLLTFAYGDLLAIKSGFTSGYGGEGPRRFSLVLQLLNSHRVEIDECDVDDALMERLDKSALTTADIEELCSAAPVRPSRWSDYILDRHHDPAHAWKSWREFRPVIPFAIIDERIIDLAIAFSRNPDDGLLRGYRRLEDIIRSRTGIIDEHGTKLFSRAFAGSPPLLGWPDIDDGEKAGRLNLFTGAYMAHRNPRAHREPKSGYSSHVVEFLLLNHLYLLEKRSHKL
jgi:uncharacterized protein Ymh